MTPKRLILKVLDELTEENLNRFTFYLRESDKRKPIPSSQLEDKKREKIVQLLLNHYGEKAVDITRDIIHEIPRRDLEWMFADGGERNGSIERTQERKRERPEGQNSAGTVSDPSESENPIPKKNKLEAKPVIEKQLMRLASKLGRNWKRIGIEFLDLKECDIDHCVSDEQDVVMQRFKMLVLWKNREKAAATAERLHTILANKDCPISSEDIDCLLEGNQ
ncbi:THO complex subunit 1 [Hemitrygon akajei]|uniref:THO complex subunit 1 n=1 Tax=Hemitrygon akajei TaxID=2704970 RepID=UPI003BF9D7D4